MIALGAGALHGEGEYRRPRQLLEQLGLLSLFIGLLPMGFVSGRLDGVRYAGGISRTLVLLLVAAFVALAVLAARLPRDTANFRLGFVVALLVVLLYGAAVKLAIEFRMPAQVFQALTYLNWFLLFALALAVIVCGARWSRTAWINWGIVFIGTHAVVRYLDLFGTMLQTSALFFTAGGLVLVLGLGLERMRRRLTAAVARLQAP
jgi:uncharacterized membrane protein